MITIKPSTIKARNSYVGESIELKVEKLVQNKEPIPGDVPLTYTERKDGVKSETNIRTDKWDVAAEAMDKAYQANQSRRDAKAKAEAEATADAKAKGEN